MRVMPITPLIPMTVVPISALIGRTAVRKNSTSSSSSFNVRVGIFCRMLYTLYKAVMPDKTVKNTQVPHLKLCTGSYGFSLISVEEGWQGLP